MQFTCDRESFAKGITAVSRVVQSRGPLPILSNVLISADNGQLKFSGTDLEIGIQVTVPAEVGKAGSITVSGKRLADIMAKLPNADVEIALEDDIRMLLKCARSKFALPGLPSDEYPKIVEAKYSDPEKVISIPGQLLLRALKSVDFACAKDDKATLAGVRFIVNDGMLDLAGTDGYRLARFTSKVESEGAFNAIVPHRALKELEKLVGPKDDVFVSLEQNQAIFSVDGRQMATRLIDGQFPPIEQIVPASFNMTAVVDRSFLRLAIERVAIMASEREAKKIDLGFTKGEIHLAANTADLGESTDVIAAEYDGGDFEISFNSAYLLDGLRALEGSSIEFKANGPLSPAVLTSAETDEQFYLLMPIRQ